MNRIARYMVYTGSLSESEERKFAVMMIEISEIAPNVQKKLHYTTKPPLPLKKQNIVSEPERDSSNKVPTGSKD